AGALDRGLWDAGPCLAWQAASAGCSGGCLARSACPVGAASRYGPEQQAYHHTHDRAHVRRALTSRDAARYPPA
ncbi:MAG TPA: hypothetical protein PKA64_11160, partial [Myxococcota bacterium]|nr:hypothetical protein [Myxococcota bacterium]